VYTDDNDVDGQDNNGCTPLHHACQFGNVDLVECLLSVFANTNITDDDKRTPVEHAKYSGNNELVSCFSQFLNMCPDTLQTSRQVSVSHSQHQVLPASLMSL
jgi:ankyrin repeat protein